MSRRRKKKTKRDSKPISTKTEKPVPSSPSPPPSREIGRSGGRRHGRIIAAGVALGVSLLIGYLAFRPGFEPRALNVIVVTIDTLRADRLGAYGGETVPTPHIDALAERGVVFEQAFASAPVTLPSHASIFTGAYPISHGVRDNGGLPLDPERTTLAEILSAEGYRTGAFVGAFVLDSRWGLDQGFEEYSDDLATGASGNLGGSEAQRRGEQVLEEALSWMDSVREERFFSWIHLFDPHTPYDPPEPYRSRFDDPYDGEIAYVDSLVGRMLEWLDENALEDETLVVLLADHGESLGEHGERTHGFFVYDATMRVPLVMRAPYEALSRRRVPDVVRTIDVMPTVLELVGIEGPPLVSGRSLVPLARGIEAEDESSARAYGEATFPSHYGWSELRSIRDQDFLFVDAPRPELYDLESDPRQEKNLAETRVEELRAYEEELRALEREIGSKTKRDTSTRRATLDPEVASRLIALGYAGASARTPTRASDSPAVDPKDKILLFNRIREAATLADAGRLDEACRFLEAVLEEDPGVLEARNMLAGYLARSGELEAAVEAYRTAIREDPDYAPAVFGLASAYLEMGRKEDAITGLEHMLALEPGNAPASFMLARALMDEGRFREALRALESIETRDAGESDNRLTMMAESRIGLGELDEAAGALESALEEDPSLPSAHHQLGVIHEKRGDMEGAIAAYEKEIEVSPDNYRAHFDLAKLLAQRGRESETLQHLERAIEANPRFALGHLYLANLLLDRGELDRASELAERGIALGPEPAFAPLGHFILADVYQRLGRTQDAAREMTTAQKMHEALNR